MWPFRRKPVDVNRIEIYLHFWGEVDPTYTVRLSVGKVEVLEAIGVVQGVDFRLSNIVTVPGFRRKGLATTVVGMLIGAARARRCATFTFENVSPRNPEATTLYQRYGAVALPPRGADGHSDHQLTF